MRSTVASLVVIVLALAAILGGYLNGQTGTRPPPVVQLHQDRRPARTATIAHDIGGEPTTDLFSDDDVVIERVPLSEPRPEQLSVVVGLAGASATLDSTFMQIGLPLAFDLDPAAPDALQVARLVRDQGDVLFIHEDHALTRASLASLRARFSQITGIASRDADGQASSLAGSGLMYFDERGDADPAPFTARGVPFVARDATADDRSERSYITYMLNRAAIRSARQGRLVVLVRPQPNTLGVLNAFAQTRSAEIVALTAGR